MEKVKQEPISIEAVRKYSGEQFRDISAMIPGLIYQFRIDTAGVYAFTFISESVKSFLGLNADELYANANLGFANIHPDDLNTVVKEGFFSSKTLKQHAFIFRIKDGSNGLYKWVRASSQPAKQADGSVTWNGMMVDITMDKETEEQRIAAVQEINSELESFSYTVSHDLQNPLRTVLGFSKILLTEYKDQLNTEIIDYLKIIDCNALRMSNLTKDLLSFSKLGRAAINYTEVDMDNQVKRAIDQLMLDGENYNAQIIKHNLTPAWCDANLIQQVWLNLIGNAFKYSAKKERPVIEIGMVADGKEQIYFIKDNGAGFDMQYLNRLFVPFQRMHSLEEFEGSGIGLAIVHRIITKHGGRVWAEATPGDGACFYFSLPVTNE